MKLRDSWYRPEGAPVLESVCIWCLRQASLCVIVDPCGDREHYEAEIVRDRRLSGQANYLLARIVAAANVSAIDGEDGFIESYNLPVGPIHKTIPFLQEQGIVVTADGQIKNGPENLT